MKTRQNLFLFSIAGLLLFQLCLMVLIYQSLPYFVQELNPKINIGSVGLSIELFTFFILLMFWFFITDSLFFSFILSNFLYVLFIFSSLLKIKFLKSPIVLYDLYQIDDLLLNLSSIGYVYLGVFLIICSLALAILFLGIKSKNKSGLRKHSFITLTLFIIISISTVAPSKELFKINKINYKWNSDIVSKTQKHGFLPIFLQSIYFSNSLQKPQNYNFYQTLQWLKKYNDEELTYTQKPLTLNRPDNVIILLVESFQDTKYLPWKTLANITPTYHKMEKSGFSGKLISPVFGGKSVNAEFELLTGFTHIFTPQGSIPYKDFVHHKIPSLAWQLKDNKYTTNVIQVVKMLGYGYKTIYENLGFDHKYSLNKNKPGISLDPTGRFGSSQAIGNQIIDILEHQDKSFVFAFPNSSHAPWKISDYPNNSIQLINNDLNKDHTEEIIAYYNALNHIDQLLAQLYLWAENSQEKTLILIVGDHQPALKAIPAIEGNLKKTKIKNHTVPFLIWSNYPVNYQSMETELTSMNLIGGVMLDLMQIEPTGFFRFNKTLRNYYQAFSFVLIKRQSTIHSKPPTNLIEHYQAFQYMFLSDN